MSGPDRGCRFVNRGRICGRPEAEHCTLGASEFHHEELLGVQPSAYEREALGIPDHVHTFVRGKPCRKPHHPYHRRGRQDR